MNESEKRQFNVVDKKAKIRERYKDVSVDKLELIPAIPLKLLNMKPGLL